MKRHIYVLVFVSSEHNARSAVIAGDASVKGMSLSKVLEQGWAPVRETPMGGNGPSFCSLVLLERDGDAPAPAVSAAPARTEQAAAAPKPAPKPAAAAPKPSPKPAAAPAPAEDPILPDEAPEPEPPKTAAKEPAKKASDSDVSFDFLENLE